MIEVNLLKQISPVLKILVEAFQNFDEEQVCICNHNSIEKIIQLHKEKIALYEHMLKEMMARLEKLLNK